METTLPKSGALLLIAQLGGAVAVITLLAAAPPAEGKFLLVPLRGATTIAALATNRGALIVGAATRFPGGMVVAGRRAALMPLLFEGVLVLAAPGAGCVAPRTAGT